MTHLFAVAVTSMIAIAASGASAGLVSISFPDEVFLNQSTTADGPRTVNAPFDFSGIGNIINPSVAPEGSGSNPSDFVLHQTVNQVDLADVVVTFEYDAPVLIDAFDVVQHHNGVRTFEVLVGNDLGSMVSIGTSTEDGDFFEYERRRFEFDTMTSGKFVQLRVTAPELTGQGGWAFYRANPVLVPAPGVACVLGFGLAAASRRRR